MCQSDYTKMHNSEAENKKKTGLCHVTKIMGQPQGPQERSCRGATKSLNTALSLFVRSADVFDWLMVMTCLQ